MGISTVDLCNPLPGEKRGAGGGNKSDVICMADAAHQRILLPQYSEVVPSCAGFTRAMCSVLKTGGCLANPDVLFSFIREGGMSEEFEVGHVFNCLVILHLRRFEPQILQTNSQRPLADSFPAFPP